MACLASFAGGTFAASGYHSVEIASPASESVIHSNDGMLEIEVVVTPPLATAYGDSLRLTVDGRVAAASTLARFVLADVPRGPHTLEVELIDLGGQAVLHSAPVVVYMWRASALFKNRGRR